MTSLHNKTIRGVGWMAASQAISQVARFGFIIALARLLTPAEFGLWGMALVFTGFAALLGDIGLGAALIQRSVIEQKHLDTAFWMNLGMGVLLTVLMIALAVPLSTLYGAKNLAPILAVASTEFTIKSVVVVHRVLLVRDMDFKSMAIQETVALIISGLIACMLAATGWGAWSLVAHNLVTALIVSVWLITIRPWRPSFRFDVASLKELLGFSIHLQGFNLLNYWLRNFDKFLIGRMLGEVPLGFYSRAYNTMLLPQSQITGTLERVMWPALARCAHDLERLRHAYFRALKMICYIGFPAMAGLTACSEVFVIGLFGEKWRGSIETLQWLCFAGFLQTPVATLGWLYLATGRTRRLLAWGLISGAITIPAMVMGALGGSIESMAMWYTGGVFILTPLAFVFAAPIADLPFLRVMQTMAPSAIASIIMAALVHLLSSHLPSLAPIMHLAVICAAGAGIYLLLTFRTDAFAEARSILHLTKSIPAPQTD